MLFILKINKIIDNVIDQRAVGSIGLVGISMRLCLHILWRGLIFSQFLQKNTLVLLLIDFLLL